MSVPRGRVLQVFPYHLAAGTGGASGVRTAIESTIELTGGEWQHVVLVPGPSPYTESFARLGADVRTLGRREHLVLRRGSSPAALLRHAGRLLVDVPRIAALIRRERIAVVHTHSSAYLGAALAARLTRRPALVHVHERLDTLPPRWAALYRRVVAAVATRVVLIAGFMEDEWAASGAHAESIPNTSRWEASGPRAAPWPVVGFVGRVAPRKGIEYLLRATERVRASRPDVEVVVYGGPGEPEDHPYLEALRAETAERGLADVVRFAGPTDDVRAALESLRVLAFTSPRDIAPITVLEAMSCGVPVVSASDGGAEEMVADGETGFTVAPGDVEALAERIGRLLGDDALWTRQSRAAVERYEAHYGRARYGRAVARLYDELARGARRPGAGPAGR